MGGQYRRQLGVKLWYAGGNDIGQYLLQLLIYLLKGEVFGLLPA